MYIAPIYMRSSAGYTIAKTNGAGICAQKLDYMLCTKVCTALV